MQTESVATIPNCSKCGAPAADHIICNACKKNAFHASCLPSSSICGLCKSGGGYATSLDTYKISLHQLIEQNKGNPLVPALIFMFQKLEQQNDAIAQCMRQIQLLGNTQGPPATQTPTRPTEKKVLLVGNDLRIIKRCLQDSMPNANLEIISLDDVDAKSLLGAASQSLELNKNNFHHHIIIHPGLADCLMNEGDSLISGIEQFMQWIQTTAPGTEVSIVSIPQYLKDICKNANEKLLSMSTSGLIKYIPLTRLQADLLIRSKRHYSPDAAVKISANLMNRHIREFLGYAPQANTPNLANQRPPLQAHGDGHTYTVHPTDQEYPAEDMYNGYQHGMRNNQYVDQGQNGTSRRRFRRRPNY